MGSRNQIGTDGSNSRTGVLDLCVLLVHLDSRWLKKDESQGKNVTLEL